jgi:hypothetical protein
VWFSSLTFTVEFVFAPEPCPTCYQTTSTTCLLTWSLHNTTDRATAIRIEIGICDVYGQPGTLLCSGCHESYYCSKVCQKRAWVDHKHLCKTLNDFRSPSATTDGTDGYMRAIYFLSDEEKPRFVWLPFKTVTSGSLVMDLGSSLAMTDEEKESGLCEASG